MPEVKMKNRKWYQNRNLLIVAGLVLFIAAVFGFAFLQNRSPAALRNAGTSQNAADEPTAYVLCSLPSSGYTGIIPLPAEGGVSYPIRQTLADGTEAENILHLTPEGFCMESATCPNQDCVHQGFVTFENRETRILQNSVICLPNRVMVSLYSAEEIAQMDLPAAGLTGSWK